MTNPNHTDTSRSGDLVERLRLCATHGLPASYNDHAEAADRIEALEAENERLRDDSWFEQFEEQEQLRDNAEQRLSVVEAKIERLSEALRGMVEYAQHNERWQDAHPEYVHAAHAALGEK